MSTKRKPVDRGELAEALRTFILSGSANGKEEMRARCIRLIPEFVRAALLAKALDEITLLAEYGTTGPRTTPPCKSDKLTAEQATSLRGAISKIARDALKGTPYEARV